MFPLIYFLARFAKQFGAALQVGQEFMATLANMDFKRPGNMLHVIISKSKSKCSETSVHIDPIKKS